ncbi:uncharacterized protein LOC119596486 [Penaeus monodon]|uniref:uncharacterized protein LOC119596486 n=1 Tax=Penaeus monodon TaxID=6687 RepID=UPI0018A6FBA3|nr:uncharacterized protein LOC119596486 [Penaeus monodon]
MSRATDGAADCRWRSYPLLWPSHLRWLQVSAPPRFAQNQWQVIRSGPAISHQDAIITSARPSAKTRGDDPRRRALEGSRRQEHPGSASLARRLAGRAAAESSPFPVLSLSVVVRPTEAHAAIGGKTAARRE